MSMKNKSNSYLFTIFLLSILIFTFCKKQENSANNLSNYTYMCPMDTQIISKTPAKCPICKMQLELKIDNAALQSNSPSKLVFSSQKTIKIDSEVNSNNLTYSGVTAIAQNRSISVPAKFGGRIEKLYIKYNFKYIEAGEKVLELYNSELLEMQEEYLFMLKSNNEKTIINKLRNRLLLSGISENQISEIEKNFTVKRTITIYSPYSGYAIFNNSQSQNTSFEENNSNSTMPMSTPKNENPYLTNLQILEGSYINYRNTIFEINDLKNLWAWFYVPSNYLKYISEKTSVDVEINNSIFKNYKIDLIEKNFDEEQSKLSKIRILIKNENNKILINYPIKVSFKTSKNNSIFIPRSAILFTGKNSIVWLKTSTLNNGNSIFKLKKIITGEIINGKVEVLSGLNIGDKIALNAGMMIDSETNSEL